MGEVFDLRSPYLLQGRTTDVRTKTELMRVAVKVYAGGGENAMHAHGHEDHTFVVLEGEAEFHLGTDENAVRVGRYQGVMLPKHAPYWFEAVGDENLVMLRVGTSDNGFQHIHIQTDGRTIAGDSPENKTVERIETGPRIRRVVTQRGGLRRICIAERECRYALLVSPCVNQKQR